MPVAGAEVKGVDGLICGSLVAATGETYAETDRSRGGLGMPVEENGPCRETLAAGPSAEGWFGSDSDRVSDGARGIEKAGLGIRPSPDAGAVSETDLRRFGGGLALVSRGSASEEGDQDAVEDVGWRPFATRGAPASPPTGVAHSMAPELSRAGDSVSPTKPASELQLSVRTVTGGRPAERSSERRLRECGGRRQLAYLPLTPVSPSKELVDDDAAVEASESDA
jgi:hypothetical protein